MRKMVLWLFLTIAPCDAVEPSRSQDAATPTMQAIIDLHHDIFFFLMIILVFVSRILVRALWHFQKEKNPIPQTIVHGTTIEILRTIFPSIILMFIAILSFALVVPYLCSYFIPVAVAMENHEGNPNLVDLDLRLGQPNVHIDWDALEELSLRPLWGPLPPLPTPTPLERIRERLWLENLSLPEGAKRPINEEAERLLAVKREMVALMSEIHGSTFFWCCGQNSKIGEQSAKPHNKFGSLNLSNPFSF